MLTNSFTIRSSGRTMKDNSTPQRKIECELQNAEEFRKIDARHIQTQITTAMCLWVR